MTIFSAWEGWRGRAHAPSGAYDPASMRQVLDALNAGEPVQWIPASRASAGWGVHRRSHRSAWLAALALMLIAGATWLVATYPVARPQSGVLAAVPSPRLEQIAATVRPPFEQIAEADRPGQPPPVLVVEDAIDIEAGKRARLSAHVANDDMVQPETVALVKGLPDDVRLTDGIMIGPGLWMVRADLLASVELDAASSASGRHTLTLELRTPEGTVISSGQTVLAIAAVRNDTITPDTTARVIDGPAGERLGSAPPKSSMRSSVVVAPVTPSAAPVRKRAVKKATAPVPVAQERDMAPGKANVERKVRVAKPARRTNPAVQSQVTVLAAKPVVPQSAQQPRLVWPGDDPRSASYLPNPPVFLGGALPGAVAPAQPPATAGGDGWRRQVFGQ